MDTLYALFPLIMTLLGSLASPEAGRQAPQGPPGGRRPPAFVEVDKNSDGRISPEEWQGPSEAFGKFDANQDGSISQDEFKAAPRRGPGGPPPAEHLLANLDSDGDSKVSQAEFGQITQLFDKLDQNKDSSLKQGELGGFFRALGGPGPGGPAGRGPRTPPDFASLDANGDKAVSRDEWKGPPQLFDQLDSSKNGTIEESELSAPPNRLQPPGGGFGGRILVYLDADGDEKVSPAEFASLAQLFSSLDTNKDGSLSREELAGFFQGIG